ncbi:MAG: ATP-binding protein [Nitrospirae bacterium]|nr:MAG: ATP-binding protein [Nitrospirota bacterium]
MEADAGQIKQLLINLLDNAIQYTPRGGKIDVRLYPDRDSVRIDIEDTGSGIPAEHLPYVFDRFYRVDASRDRNSGCAGLGLAIAKDIVDAHGGTISVDSLVGQGTTFSIILPLAHQVTRSSGS